MNEEISEAELLSSMQDEARRYITDFAWAPTITGENMCFGIGGVVAIFLFEFAKPIVGTKDDRLWVFVGDLPSAYLVVEDPDGPRDAMARYCEVMADWCNAVESGANMDDVYPVAAPASMENVELLRSRITFIRDELLGQIPEV